MNAQNNSSAPLLPCPFCGAAARMKPSTRGDYTSIVCNSPCAGPLAIVVPNDQIEAGIAAWNTRAPQAVEAQAPAAVAVPEGWKLVPLQDTPKMWTAGGQAIKSCGGHDRDAASLAYKAMLEAAPTREIPATVDSSAGELAEVQAESVPNLSPSSIAAAVCQRVAELDDRSSPADWPEAMLVTQDELQTILIEELAATLPAPSELQRETVTKLLELARIVDRAVEDWGESLADGSSNVIFHKEEADARDAILEFLDSLPENPDPMILESGPLKAARLLAAPQAQPADALDAAADLWYLQDTRSYVGNDVLWWAKDSNGYTTDISKAHAYTRDDAFRQAAMRGCDRAWPKAYIDGKTRPAVDMQYIDHQAAMAAAQPCSDTPDQGLPLLQEGRENGYGTCTIDYDMSAAQTKNEDKASTAGQSPRQPL